LLKLSAEGNIITISPQTTAAAAASITERATDLALGRGPIEKTLVAMLNL